MNKGLIVILLSSLLLSGCGNWVKSSYQRPLISVPVQWPLHDSGQGSRVNWLDNFNDPQLTRLVSEVLKSNNDMSRAALQLQKARLQAGLANTNMAPEISLSGTANRSKYLHSPSTDQVSYNSNLELSYELDLWGKLARVREQAQWEAEASEQDKQEVALTLIGNTAQYYWQIANLNQQILQQKKGIDIADQTLKITQSRYRAGEISMADVLQAQQSIIGKNSQLNSLQQQREESRNALAILFNRPPQDRRQEKNSLDPTQDVAIAIHTPLETIARRPDIRAAESQLRAALAGSDVARLNFYPELSLTASLGAASTIFQQWFSTTAGALGGSLMLPFAQWNKVQLTIELSGIDVKIAAINFRSKVYDALSDVDNAFALRLSYQQRRQYQQKIVMLAEQQVKITRSQYFAGEVSFQTWLDAQDNLLSGEQTLSDLQYNYLCATLKLWLALGG